MALLLYNTEVELLINRRLEDSTAQRQPVADALFLCVKNTPPPTAHGRLNADYGLVERGVICKTMTITAGVDWGSL